MILNTVFQSCTVFCKNVCTSLHFCLYNTFTFMFGWFDIKKKKIIHNGGKGYSFFFLFKWTLEECGMHLHSAFKRGSVKQDYVIKSNYQAQESSEKTSQMERVWPYAYKDEAIFPNLKGLVRRASIEEETKSPWFLWMSNRDQKVRL